MQITMINDKILFEFTVNLIPVDEHFFNSELQIRVYRVSSN